MSFGGGGGGKRNWVGEWYAQKANEEAIETSRAQRAYLQSMTAQNEMDRARLMLEETQSAADEAKNRSFFRRHSRSQLLQAPGYGGFSHNWQYRPWTGGVVRRAPGTGAVGAPPPTQDDGGGGGAGRTGDDFDVLSFGESGLDDRFGEGYLFHRAGGNLVVPKGFAKKYPGACGPGGNSQSCSFMLSLQ